MTKATPGPWKVSRDDPDRLHIQTAAEWPGALTVASLRRIGQPPNGDGDLSEDVAEANACLIAAAPDLRDALRDLLAEAKRARDLLASLPDATVKESATIVRAEAALKAARGP